MNLEAYQDWISIYSDNLEPIWLKESEQFRKISMIYLAFQNELDRLKKTLHDDLEEIRTDYKRKNWREKCKNFHGLVQSEKFDDVVIIDKENESPPESPIKVPAAVLPTQTSPILNKNKFTCDLLDDSNILEASVIETTPIIRKPPAKKRKKQRLNRSKQSNTLTQMFVEPEAKISIQSNDPSMGITQMLRKMNETSSTLAEESDETVDDLEELLQDETTKDSIRPQVYDEVVRGKERLKLKGWSCKECQDYYEAMDLSAEELEKKKDQCSKHRFRFQPRQETFEDFWDLTFKNRSKVGESQSMVLNYKKK